MRFLCRHGIHRNLVREERTYSRTVTGNGETVDSKESKTCRCGVVIETKSYSSHEATVTKPATKKESAV